MYKIMKLNKIATEGLEKFPLDKYDIGLKIIQVLDERPMPAGPEQEFSVLIPEGLVCRVHCQCIGRGFLFRIRDLEMYAIALLELRNGIL